MCNETPGKTVVRNLPMHTSIENALEDAWANERPVKTVLYHGPDGLVRGFAVYNTPGGDT